MSFQWWSELNKKVAAKNEAQEKRFSKIISELLQSITSQKDERSAFVENQKLLEELYTTVVEMINSWWTPGSFINYLPRLEGAETFPKQILGKQPSDTRAKILCIMLRLSVVPEREEGIVLWSSFFRSLYHEPPDFCDAKLPFSVEHAEFFLGDEGTGRLFEEAQYRYYPVDSTNSFEHDFRELKQVIEKAKVMTLVRDKDGNKVRRQSTDHFYPDNEVKRIIKAQKPSIARLYVECFKAGLDPPASKSSDWNRSTYYELCHTESEATRFCESVQCNPKTFSIFMSMNITDISKIWDWFRRHFLDSHEDTRLADKNLPVDYQTVVDELLVDGDSSYEDFFWRQFAFCAPKLKKNEQIAFVGEEARLRNFSSEEQYLRLPLRSRKAIGKGTSGEVFEVIVEPGYFTSGSEGQPVATGPLAMKRAPLTGPNALEWNHMTRLFAQQLKSEGIMRARASLATDNYIYIFSNLASCNLYEYMVDAKPDGPVDLEDMRNHFRKIIDIASALKYLHHDLQEEQNRERIECWHMDVKAENILVTTQPKLLFQITDFGISSIKAGPEASETISVGRDAPLLRQQGTRARLGGGCSNFPPEAANKGSVDHKADVWGFGTVFAYFVAWLYGGKKGLDKFHEKVSTTTHGKPSRWELYELRSEDSEPCLKRSVTDYFIDMVREFDPDTEFTEFSFILSCWWLLDTRLLVCQKASRADMRQICEFLEKILQGKPVFKLDAAIPNFRTTRTEAAEFEMAYNDFK